MMRRWLAVTMLLALPSCASDFTLFADQMAYPDDIPCSDAGTCPPNEVCVAGEHMCRYACAADGRCPSAHMASNGLSCDIDHFCRIACGPVGPGPMCAGMPAPPSLQGCPTGQVCDELGGINVCRPICSGMPGVPACPMGFSCSTLPQTDCGGCRPGT